jgi:hypothetical protein
MDVIYLTNACGEETYKGTIAPTEGDLALVDFDRSPGVVLQYMAEIEGKAYALGNLEICYKGDIFDGDDFWTEDEAKKISDEVAEFLRVRAQKEMRVLPVDDTDEGRFTVGLAIPLDTLSSRQEAGIAFRAAFGSYCEATCYVWHGEGECDNSSPDIVEAFRWQKELEAEGYDNVLLTDIHNEMLDPSLVEKYCAPILVKQNHTPKMGM